MSRPTRACGLKPYIGAVIDGGLGVTPHTGVWIETSYKGKSVKTETVTPHTGVWIETTTSKRCGP